MEKDIKDYRNAELKHYIIGNILLVLVSSGLLDKMILFTGESTIFEAVTSIISSTVFSAILYIYIFLADSLVPGEWKNNLIWLSFLKPGNSIFTRIRENNKDERFTSENARKIYKETYDKLDKAKGRVKENIENSSWYKIYIKHETHAQVRVSQRDFLLCRDMSVMTIFVAIGYICLQTYLKNSVSLKMLLIFVIEFFICWIAALTKSWRFAYNVIAIDIAKYDKKDDKRDEKKEDNLKYIVTVKANKL